MYLFSPLFSERIGWYRTFSEDGLNNKKMEIKDDCFHLIDGQFNCRSCGLKQTKLNVLLWTGDFNGRKGPKETRGSQSQYCPDCGCIFGCPFPEGDRVRRCVECADCYRQHEEEEFLLNILVQCTLPSDLGLLCLAYSMSTSTSFMPDTTPKGFWRLTDFCAECPGCITKYKVLGFYSTYAMAAIPLVSPRIPIIPITATCH